MSAREKGCSLKYRNMNDGGILQKNLLSATYVEQRAILQANPSHGLLSSN